MCAFLRIRSRYESEPDSKQVYPGWSFIYLVFQIFYLYYCLLPSAEEKTWEGLVYLCIAQSVLFAAAIFCSFLVSFLEYQKKKLSSPFKALYVISGDGKIKNQVY